MRPSVFDILRHELACLQKSFHQFAAQAKSGKITRSDIPDVVPKAVTSGRMGVDPVRGATLWFTAAIAVLNHVLSRPEVILSRGVKVALAKLGTLQLPQKLTGENRRLTYQYASLYRQSLGRRLAPECLDVLAGRNPWFESEVRSALYRRLQIERSSRQVIEKLALNGGPAGLIFERDGARYRLFLALCASRAFATRPQFLQELEILRVHPLIPKDVLDREGYRLAWLSAVQEIKEEVLAMKPKKASSLPENTMPKSPTKGRPSEEGPQTQAPPTVESGTKTKEMEEPQTVELLIEGVDWTDKAALLGDEKERSYITRFRNTYNDFFYALPYSDLQCDPAAMLIHAKSLVNIINSMMAIWNDLEGYRASRLRKLGNGHSRSSLRTASEVIAEKIRFCQREFDNLAADCRRRADQPHDRTSSRGRYYEVSALLEREQARLTTLIDERLAISKSDSRKIRSRSLCRMT